MDICCWLLNIKVRVWIYDKEEVTGRWKISNGELHKLYPSTNTIIGDKKSKEHEIYGTQKLWEVINMHIVLSGILERTLEKCKREREDNVMYKVFLVQNGVQYTTFVNAAMNYLVPLK
jgi:hypothetical protein